jgi:hypothetical protein
MAPTVTIVECPRATARAEPKSHFSPEPPVRKFRPVAQLITPAPPNWLGEHLLTWAHEVAVCLSMEQFQQKRAELTEDLRKIRKAAAFMRQRLDELSVCQFLSASGDEPLDAPYKFQIVLSELEIRAANAVNSPNLVDDKGKVKAGTGRAMPEGTISAHTYCALLIAEAWKKIHGKHPAPRNRNALEATDLYWHLVGGKRPPSWGDDHLMAWRHHLKQATTISNVRDRAEIRRHMDIAAGFEKFLNSDFARHAGN